MDATFVNKWPTGVGDGLRAIPLTATRCKTRTKDGGKVALLHAFADYVVEDGSHRATFIPGALERSVGVSFDSSRVSPWFEGVLLDGRSFFGGVAIEVHLFKSMAHIYSADSNPRDTLHRMDDLLQEAISVCDAMEGEAEDAEIACQLKDFSPGATKKDMVRFLTTASGAMVPDIFKTAREYGCVVFERTPLT